ncbi:MAG: glycosyltransferase family 87 protein [Candidatus Hodarchaeota archaeon]
MVIEKLYSKISNRFKVLWQYKIFRYATILHGVYFMLSLILTLTIFRNQNDFLVYYKVGEVFINNITDLYTADYNWPFRYFPISALLFIPYYLLGFDLGFIMFNIVNLILNVLICKFLYKIIMVVKGVDHEPEEKRVIFYICLYLMSLSQVFNYILGQINLYITLFLLISLYLFLKYESLKWNLVTSIILGISVIIKPITLFLIPFLIIINFDLEIKKFEIQFLKSIIRLVGFIIPLSLNIFIFLIHSELLEGFLSVNFTGEDTVLINHSFSITKLIQNFFIFIGFSQSQLLSFQLPLFIIILIIIGGIGFVFYLVRRLDNYSLIYGYTLGILIMLLGYFDSWDHHLLILTPLLIIIIFNLPRESKLTKEFIKPSFFFLSFFDLAFMGIWFLLQNYFPFNFVPTIFLLLSFYTMSKYCLTKEMQSNNKKF